MKQQLFGFAWFALAAAFSACSGVSSAPPAPVAAAGSDAGPEQDAGTDAAPDAGKELSKNWHSAVK